VFRSPQNLDEAVDEVGRWADSLPGDFAVEVTGFDDATVIQVTGALTSSGLVLRAGLLVTPGRAVEQSRCNR